MPDLRPDLDPALEAFGASATVTPLGGSPTLVTIIDTGRPDPPGVGDLGMSAAAAVRLRKVVAVPRAAVASLPVGSTIIADLDGAGPRAWRVDRVDALVSDEYRVVIS